MPSYILNDDKYNKLYYMMTNVMKRLYCSLLIACFSMSVSLADTTKPWTFWYWMYGAVSEEGIKADLKAMKDVGLGGCYLMPIRGSKEQPDFKGQAGMPGSSFFIPVPMQ